MQRLIALFALVLTAAACGGSSVDISDVPALEQVTESQLASIISTSSQPVVVNVWASWCVPCRSEAPLLERAAAAEADAVRFIGLNVRDDQDGARSFIAEFFPDAPIDHLFDPGGDLPISLGGTRGVPLTFFFAPDGQLVNLHTGVIDERTLALQIDEIKAR